MEKVALTFFSLYANVIQSFEIFFQYIHRITRIPRIFSIKEAIREKNFHYGRTLKYH
jgi:hypothetical protein